MSSWMIYVAIVVVALAITGIVWAILRLFHGNNTSDNEDTADTIWDEDDLSGRDAVAVERPRRSLVASWGHLWGDVSRVLHRSRTDGQAGRDAIFVILALAVILSLAFHNVLTGVGVSFVLVMALGLFLRSRIASDESQIDDQLPNFIHTVSSYLESNETIEAAIRNAIDTSSGALGRELAPTRQRLMAAERFSDTMMALADETTSKALGMFARNAAQASTSGSNFRYQLTQILANIESNRLIDQEITRAVKGTKPVKVVATITIPAIFVVSWFSFDQARQYWFKVPSSWLVLLVIVALYAIGLWWTKRLASNMKAKK